MKWIKLLFKPFLWIYNNLDSGVEESSRNSCRKKSARINPTTGLPMRGAFDSAGNTLGTSSSNWNNDYGRSHSSYSNFNSFNNKF
ncbi:hypothetical protein B0B39_19095 (plasmid) [Legionella longbeachae]|uniref:hypothetical protein n=1 Tax=Legionella longbeachae TaxID=450 RepID=UPI000F739310|nr:hypothetical protein [Legionella longbeachae]QED10782.1 hypothetical protein B0B39_19095 [Legionella longbeachae]